MRTIISLILATVAMALFWMALTMNWPSIPSEWSSGSTRVSWWWYVVGMLLAILAILIYWWRDIKRFYRSWKKINNDVHKRLVNQGIGYKENKKRKNPWPKRQMLF
jgi:protein-S-isoprenylcysteine O-methyltransferase Ste14